MNDPVRTGAVRAEVDIEVRYAETDQMGVVHHSHYLVWFEVARTHLCLETGRHYADIEKLGYGLVVSGAETRFISPANYGDTLQVVCWLEKMASRRLRFHYEVRRDEQVLATGATEHIWVDYKTKRPCRTPAELQGPFKELAGQP